jgi:nucleoside-diphosphate-sugar epimerase
MRGRVLVTGGTGCIGRHALPRLVARGWEVHAVAGRQSAPDEPGVVWHRADLLDAAEVRQIARDVGATELLHLAWYIAPGQWARAPENVAWVRASLDLLDAFAAAGGRRVVTAGSCLEYDWSYGYCAEDRTPCTPHTAYGASKHALQLLTSAFADARGLTSAWGRIFFLYGPFEHPDRLVASVIRSLLRGEPARCSHGRQVRDYLFADDVADALVALLASDVSGPVNIGSGEPIRLRDLAGRAADLLERRELVHFGAIPAAPTDTPLVVADVGRLRDELGWRPSVDLDAGLRRTIDWWRSQLLAGQEAGTWSA